MHELLMKNQDVWDLFTRKEEYYPEKLDEHQRFLFSEKDLLNASEPKVSRYLMKNGMQVEFPENKSFAVCLTHDVDDIYPPLSHSLLSSAYCLKQLNFQEFLAQSLWKLRGIDYSPYLNFSKIMDLEASFEAKSSFYFITAEADPVRFRYNIDVQKKVDIYLKTLLNKFIDNFHNSIGEVIKENLNKYSNDMLIELIESKAGNDLQLIRINGSVVGGLVGILFFLLNNGF